MQVAGRPMVDRANRSGRLLQDRQPLLLLDARHQAASRAESCPIANVKGSPPVLVMNERLAKRNFPNEDPIGQRILIQEIVPGKTGLGPDMSWEVVGVIRRREDRRHGRRSQRRRLRLERAEPGLRHDLSVRASVDPLTLQKPISAAMRSVNKDQALTDIRTVDQIKDLSMGGNRAAVHVDGHLRRSSR